MESATLIRRALLTASILCSVTTITALLLVTLNVMGWLGAVLGALRFGSGAAESGGLIMAVFTVGSFALSAPIALGSVVLHAVGCATALAARRFGSGPLAFALAGFHAVTFLIGTAVLLFWILSMLGGG